MVIGGRGEEGAVEIVRKGKPSADGSVIGSCDAEIDCFVGCAVR